VDDGDTDVGAEGTGWKQTMNRPDIGSLGLSFIYQPLGNQVTQFLVYLAFK